MAACWPPTLMWAPSIRQCLIHRGLLTRVYLYRIPLMANNQRLRLLWTHEPGKLIRTKLSFQMNHVSTYGSMMAARVRSYAFQRCVPEWENEQLSSLTHGVMVRGAILYHGRSNLLRIESYFNTNRSIHKVLQPEVVHFLQGLPETIFLQDNACPHVWKIV